MSPLVTQYGIRWPTGSVFTYRTREEAEIMLRFDGRGVGVLVVHEYEPAASNSTPWREVGGTCARCGASGGVHHMPPDRPDFWLCLECDD